jgi:hypothetical protein
VSRLAAVKRTTSEVHPDPSLEGAEERRWHSVAVEPDDRTLRVHYVRGPWQALHHVDVDLGSNEVRLTVLLGLTHEHVERAARGWVGGYVLMGLEEWTRVVLPEPLAGRSIVGSVADGRPGAVIHESEF